MKLGIFNPFVNQGAIHEFTHNPNLNFGHKFLIVTLTALSTLVTLPLFGIGGVATFRSLTRRFAVIDNKDSNASSVTKAAKETGVLPSSPNAGGTPTEGGGN